MFPTSFQAVAFAVGAYITAAYRFTASTSFANPAVTIARCVSDTFAGIRPTDVPWFVIAQFLGGIAATLVFRWLVSNLQFRAKEVLLAHDSAESLVSGHFLQSVHSLDV
jgi:glycerol uptake facilitator-like aquaporin